VPTETFQGEPIWRQPPTAIEIEARRVQFHRPYHAELDRLLRAKVARFGRCLLIDAHSVESRASRLHGPLVEDIFLGDRDGTTCEARTTTLVRELFAAQRLRVSLNRPYKGGYITAHYHTVPGVQTLQIEMCQRLYMKEGEPQGAPGQAVFREFSATLKLIFAAISDSLVSPGPSTSLADRRD
jgi:formiminoglutamase